MDNGEVIPALNESWSFMGANATEWMQGFAMFFVLSAFVEKITHQIPWLLLAMIGTTYGLATLRKMFPDEQRGVRNKLMVLVGIPPPGIPPPANLQPRWSGAPMRALKKDSRFQILDLNAALTVKSAEAAAQEFNGYTPRVKK